MNNSTATVRNQAVTWNQALALSGLAVAAFYLAYSVRNLSPLILVFLYCLCALTRLGTDRRAFYSGLAIGMMVYAPQLYFFYTIFGAAAVALWLVLAFWLGLFLLLARRSRERFGSGLAVLLIPFIWTGLYNTAFVIGTNAEIVFQQVKSVPIQFFKDGLPAKEQRLWNSPWGKIGICVCYDLSYTRVTDELIRQGAQALIVPTMDVSDWGEHQHRLHARVAPVRAAEYGIPIFRVCSSGVSQLIDRHGRVIATAPFPGEKAMIEGSLRLKEPGGRPLDRWLSPLAVLITAAIIIWFGLSGWRRRRVSPNLNY